MSQSHGTGSPIIFHCPKWRRRWAHTRKAPGSRPHRVELTGRQRPYSPAWGNGLGTRSTRISREYRCRDCGHVGWSNHRDLEWTRKDEHSPLCAVVGSRLLACDPFPLRHAIIIDCTCGAEG